MQQLTKVFKALSDSKRLKIFTLLSRRILCVNALVNCLGISQPAVDVPAPPEFAAQTEHATPVVPISVHDS